MQMLSLSVREVNVTFYRRPNAKDDDHAADLATLNIMQVPHKTETSNVAEDNQEVSATVGFEGEVPQRLRT